MAKSCLSANVGVADPDAVVFKNTETVRVVAFATAMSGLASPLRSPSATELGVVPAAKSTLVAKLGVPAPAAKAVRAAAKPFVDWLEQAESSDEEDDDE